MTIEPRNSNQLLAAVCHLVIEKHCEKTGSLPTGVQFNKYLSLLNKGTGDRESPLSLPHAWYRWGDEVVRIHMPSGVGWNHEDPPTTRVEWDGEVPEVPAPSHFMKLIDKLTDEYTKEGSLARMIDRVYSYAPFPFQDSYRALRNTYLDIMGAQVPIDEIQEPVVLADLEEALRVFPYADFPEFAEHVEPFRNVMEFLVKQETEGLPLAIETSEAFWFAFCYHLRLHPKAHDNVPQQTLDYWRASLEDHMNHYVNAFDGLVLEIRDQFPKVMKEQPLSDLIEGAESRQNEAVALIESFDEDLKDLGKFLRKMREARESAEG